ncbi:hypothetical protein BCR32DRAFT_250354 [Anaeromyces robustus]|uniref:Uncharacterized protein n=1 Tax=Anaeromyces robustus TaxID=1754192 RepID=A0A1Y1W5E5_9FUNG|nr:hypothetical protein BCR32DRAFT_250354 [Anaeromyces robustus]|eukprot:ORX68434.1 hypothetical protein BCR32DRAFT_250354 [Anaeromyces robustus]
MDNDSDDEDEDDLDEEHNHYPSLAEIVNELEIFYGIKEDSLQNNKEAWKKLSLKDDNSLRKVFEIAEKVDRLITKSDDDYSEQAQFNSRKTNFNKKNFHDHKRSNDTNVDELTKKMQNLSINGRGSTPVVNKTASILCQPESVEQIEEKFEEEKFSDSDNSLNDAVEFLVNAIKRKAQNDSEENESPKEKRVHRSLQDDPRTIATPALRKRKENELREKPSQAKELTPQIHPSIAAQPRIGKQIEKDLRDKERSKASTSKEDKQNNTSDVIEIDEDSENSSNKTK